MFDIHRKRGGELEAPPNSTEVRESKRFKGEETDLSSEFSQLDRFTLAEEEAAASSEDLVSGVMRTLEEDISATCSTLYSLIPVDNSWAFDISCGCEGQTLVSDSGIDLSYLLEASDDDLGIPSGPVLDLKDDEVCQFLWETSPAQGLSENPGLNYVSQNWSFEDEVENDHRCVLYEYTWDYSQVVDYMNRDSINQGMFFEEDFSAAWILETTDCT